MSDIKYGLISKIDSECIEATLNYICNDFPDEEIRTCEVGVYSGLTSAGICKYLDSKRKIYTYTGIDSGKDGEELKDFPPLATLIKGNSNEVYNQIKDNSQHLIIIDANHSFPYVISDYYCFKNKVKVGGYLCFHDTAPQAQGVGWQGIGDKNDPDMGIAVRKALKDIGLLPNQDLHESVTYWHCGWQKIFDEFDPTNEMGGVCIFKRTRMELWD